MTSRFILPAPFADKSVPTGLLIGGAWRNTQKTVRVDNPATGTGLAQVADGNEADGLLAVDAAANGLAVLDPRAARFGIRWEF